MIHQFRSKQFLVFLMTGGTAAAVNFASRVLYNLWMSFSQAIVLAYITGMTTSFILAKLFVFKKSQKALHHSALYFLLVNLVTAVQTWMISMLLAYYALPAIGIHHYVTEIAHAIGLILPVFTSYLGHKHFSFR